MSQRGQPTPTEARVWRCRGVMMLGQGRYPTPPEAKTTWLEAMWRLVRSGERGCMQTADAGSGAR
ncbi:hypothetical protein ACO0M4_33630 [Streptomyces sp. RGM 3693]|uniref:hypothetical protein n=1 Tax=Streptomyces sp. RGM 3693 TaxID=3413284 RepID=UPI003D2BCF02